MPSGGTHDNFLSSGLALDCNQISTFLLKTPGSFKPDDENVALAAYWRVSKINTHAAPYKVVSACKDVILCGFVLLASVPLM